MVFDDGAQSPSWSRVLITRPMTWFRRLAIRAPASRPPAPTQEARAAPAQATAARPRPVRWEPRHGRSGPSATATLGPVERRRRRRGPATSCSRPWRPGRVRTGSPSSRRRARCCSAGRSARSSSADAEGNAYIAGLVHRAARRRPRRDGAPGQHRCLRRQARRQGPRRVRIARCGCAATASQSIAVDANRPDRRVGDGDGHRRCSPPTARCSSWSRLAGDVAFNSHGDLLIAGTFGQPTSISVMARSRSRHRQHGGLRHRARRQRPAPVEAMWSPASSVHTTKRRGRQPRQRRARRLLREARFDLFGDHFTAIFFAGESGRVSGAYRLRARRPAASRPGRWAASTGSEANGVATDPSDNANHRRRHHPPATPAYLPHHPRSAGSTRTGTGDRRRPRDWRPPAATVGA